MTVRSIVSNVLSSTMFFIAFPLRFVVSGILVGAQFVQCGGGSIHSREKECFLFDHLIEFVV